MLLIDHRVIYSYPNKGVVYEAVRYGVHRNIFFNAGY